MQNVKLIALDLDGTMLDEKSRLRPRTKAVLERAASRGIHIVVASGRAFSALPGEVLALPGLSYALTANGAAAYDPASGKRCFEFLMEAEKVEQILKLLEENPEQEIEVCCQGVPCGSKRYLEEPTRFGAPARSVAYLQSTRKPVKDIRSFVWEHRHHLDSMDLINDKPAERKAWIEKLEKIGGIYITSSVFYRIELSSRHSGKGAALKKAAELLQIKPEEIIAFGNAENDMDMLQFAGISVAVENSPDAVKEAADYIAPPNYEEGVAQMLEKLLGL